MRGVRSLLVAVFCSAVFTAAAAAGPAGTPRVRVPDTTPFTVRGTGFEPRERVTVTIVMDGSHARAVTAGATGVFVVTFPTVELKECVSYSVRAVGSHGSKAAFKPPRVMCGPPPPPPPEP